MACEVCEHCQSPVSREERIRDHEGYSYHKKCHKCYVCSETNLQNAEVFKGVIFCSSCAQRIFQGCSTARKTKTMHSGRVKRPRSRSHRRDRTRTREREDRKPDRCRCGVIELAGMVGSTTDSEDLQKQKLKEPSKRTVDSELGLQTGREKQEANCYYLQQMKKNSTEIGTTTEITQELLRQINCPVPECRAKDKPQTILPPKKRHKTKEHKPICSDLRIAELGKSTEIANMALRKKSELPVIIKSDTRLKERPSYSLSVLNQESDMSGDGSDWLDSAYSPIEDTARTNMMDRRLGSILRMPIQYFKKNILTRSSLISVLIRTDSNCKNLNIIRKFKELLYEEIAAHQGRGVQRLYSSINRRRTPYKLGWVDLVAKVSNVVEERSDVCVCDNRCKHFRHSHSYRCMRAQVMKLAGPTNSQLACYRNKKKKIIAPQFLRNIITSNKSDPVAVKMSQACGSDPRTSNRRINRTF